jgi:hypothetical protein
MVAGIRYCVDEPDAAEAQGMSPAQMEKLFLSLR